MHCVCVLWLRVCVLLHLCYIGMLCVAVVACICVCAFAVCVCVAYDVVISICCMSRSVYVDDCVSYL